MIIVTLLSLVREESLQNIQIIEDSQREAFNTLKKWLIRG